jgi:hypothetical protein
LVATQVWALHNRTVHNKNIYAARHYASLHNKKVYAAGYYASLHK